MAAGFFVKQFMSLQQPQFSRDRCGLTPLFGNVRGLRAVPGVAQITIPQALNQEITATDDLRELPAKAATH